MGAVQELVVRSISFDYAPHWAFEKRHHDRDDDTCTTTWVWDQQKSVQYPLQIKEQCQTGSRASFLRWKVQSLSEDNSFTSVTLIAPDSLGQIEHDLVLLCAA